MILSKLIPTKPFSQSDFQALSGLWRIDRVILDTLNYEKLIEHIVNAILVELNFLNLGYEIIVLTLVNKKRRTIQRISISKTDTAIKSLEHTPIPFSEIEIPLSSDANLLAKAVRNHKMYITHDLSDVLYPAGTREDWRRIQNVCGIKTSIVFPVISRKSVLGAMIFSLSKSETKVSQQEWQILTGFTNAVGIALNNATLYKKLEAANNKLQELDKRKDEFLSVAAHELRAPLTAVRGYLSMVMDGDAGPISPQMQQFLEGAVEGAEREIRLVNNMLNVSRIEEGRLVYQMGTVALTKVVETAFNQFKIDAESKGLVFTLETTGITDDTVYVDQDRIHEVVSNFISNAIKYTDKGSVTVKLRQSDPHTLRFEVHDTGYGISEEEQKKLFQKFYRSQSSAGRVLGTGLGLYITKLLLHKFGGELGLESTLGQGSMFWFELPIAETKVTTSSQ